MPNLDRLIQRAAVGDYSELHAWSVANRAEFWELVIKELNIHFYEPYSEVLDLKNGVADPIWLKNSKYNIANSCFQADANDIAVIVGSEHTSELIEYTYADLKAAADRVSNGLQQLNLAEGSGVAVLMPLHFECIASYLGIIQAGYQAVSIAESFSAVEIEKRYRLGNAKAIICEESYQRGGKEINLYDRVKEANLTLGIIMRSSEEPLREGDLDWKTFTADASPFHAVAKGPDHIINILFSSGTTGDPKAIPWTQLTPIKSAMDGRYHQDISTGDVVAWPTSLGWMMGPWLIFASLINRASIALYNGAPTSKSFIDFIKQSEVTMLGVVPAIVRYWKQKDLIQASELKSIKVFSSTGEASNEKDYKWLMSCANNAPVIEYCGGTEIGGGHITGTVLQPAQAAKFSTPALGIDFVILKDYGKPAEENEEGELFLIPPSIGLSQKLLNKDHHQVYYADCPTHNGQTLRRHGDQIKVLPDGYYSAEGRVDDCMNLGGIKVSSLEIENILLTHPDVDSCAAVSARLFEDSTEELIVFVVSSASPNLEELQKELNQLIKKELNPLFRISKIKLIDTLPRTASGKVQRRMLRAQV